MSDPPMTVPQQTLYAFVGSLWLVVDSRLHPLNNLALQSNEIRTTNIVNPIPETFPLQNALRLACGLTPSNA
jgi:hypothetical protein